MKSVLLIGLGRFGVEMAKKLFELKHEVMAIDNDEERVNEVLPYVTASQIGDSTSKEMLQSLGVNSYDICFVAIANNFQSSLETTSLLKDLGANFIVAQASNDVHEKFLLRNGADYVINPTKQMARWTAIRFTSDHIFDYIKLDDEHAIIEIQVPRTWIGKTVGQIDIRKSYGINIMATKKKNELNASITPDTVITDDMTLLVLGNLKKLQKCFHI